MNTTSTSDSTQKRVFQAEVKQILDIVIHSLYTHRDIFVRELISNAADALEKLRYEKVSNPEIADADLPLEIRIDVDENAKTLTIIDTGVGLTEDEAIQNLGAIAHSGTREFLKRIRESGGAVDAQLIGQFGVGFYSAFMAAKRVRVQSRSFRREARPIEWVSDGEGEYTIGPCGGLSRGTRIILELRDDAHEFASKEELKRIVQRYSNFVPFPILIGGEKVNTVQAIWAKSRSDISESDYEAFYQFVANDSQPPHLRLHFSADAPLQMHALLYFPKNNIENFGFGRMDPGVNLYCRKVLIQAHSEAILPEWLRFARGVVDSEDLPLNISRETMQDNALVRKLRGVLTKRVIKFLSETANKEPDKYLDFWKEFGRFIKEGVTTDFEYRADLAELLRYESSHGETGKPTSLTDYVSRMPEDQKKIYFVSGPNRESVERSPYLEAFRARGIEVLYVYDTADEFVLSTLHSFKDKPIASADQTDLDLPELKVEENDREETKGLDRDEAESLAGWLKSVLGDRVGAVQESKRLVEAPAILVNPNAMMTTGMQKVLQAMQGGEGISGVMNLEINPKHPILVSMAQRRKENENDPLLRLAAEQLHDAAAMAAGLEPDPRGAAQRTYQMIERALKAQSHGGKQNATDA